MQLGKYQLGAPLGQGGMGAVFASYHPQLARPVAIKLMADGASADAQARQRFLREAQTVAALSHPHIINIFDVGEDDGRPYIVMELLDSSLAARLRQGPLPLDETLALALPLLDALGYAHSQGLVHRDLKPANVLLRADGSPVLADFGLARPSQPDPSSRVTESGVVLGTLAYMAPEQFRGAPLDARTDIYALGVMLFELLTGKLPFDGDTAQILRGHLQDAPPPPRSLNPAIPQPVEQLILAMLAKEPDARPQSAAAIADALRSARPAPATGPTIALAQPAEPPPTEALPRPAPASRLRYAVLAMIFVSMMVSLGLLAFVVAPRRAASRPVAGATAAPTQALAPLELTRLGEAPMAGARPAGGRHPFTVAGVTYAQDVNTARFYGEIRNDGDTPQSNIMVRISLLDEQERVLASEDWNLPLAYLAPGGTSPFMLLFSGDNPPPESFADFSIEVLSRDASDFDLRTTVRDALRLGDDLEVGASSFGSYPVVRGSLTNADERPLQFPQVFVVFYDAEGAVVGLTNTFGVTEGEEHTLAAGATTTFETTFLTLTRRIDEVASYMIYVEGRRYD